MLESFDSLIAWLALHPEWLGWAIFLVACIECLALAGILVPGVAILFGLGVLAGGGVLSLGETLLLALSGGLLGDALSYAIGRRFHQRIRRLPLLRDHPEWCGEVLCLAQGGKAGGMSRDDPGQAGKARAGAGLVESPISEPVPK